MRRTRILAIALVAATLVPASTAAQSPAPVGVGHLREAFYAMPQGVVTDMAFTDWARIRASLGAAEMTGDSPLEAKLDVLMATNRAEAAASGFGLARLRDHRDVWGFDTFDLDWEATYSVDGPPVFVLRFRDGFDLASVARLFDERGFDTTEVPGAVIRSHDMDLSEDWLTATEFAILNTAFLDDGRTLMLSSDQETLTDVLDARFRRGRNDPAEVEAALDVLDGVSAARLLLGLGTCVAFTPMPFDPFDPDPSLAPLPSGEPLHPYTVLGVGYARPGWDPVGRIVMGFPDATWAAADAEARAEVARTGTSLRVQRPYSEAVFTLEDASVRDRALVLEVAPMDDLPRRVFQMIDARDMSFAGC